MSADDADQVLAIYQAGINTGHATFERSAGEWPAFDAGKLETPRLVAADEDNRVLGWAVLSPTSSRCVYGGVAEVTIYVASRAQGQGVGKALLDALVEASEAAGIWTLVAGIMVENEASIILHERCGFERLGVRKRLGKMGFGPMEGEWRDVLQMERRSTVVGVD